MVLHNSQNQASFNENCSYFNFQVSLSAADTDSFLFTKYRWVCLYLLKQSQEYVIYMLVFLQEWIIASECRL